MGTPTPALGRWMTARSTTHPTRTASGTSLTAIAARMYPGQVVGAVVPQGVSREPDAQGFEVVDDDGRTVDTIEVTWPESDIQRATVAYRDLVERTEDARVALHQAVRAGGEAGFSEHYLASLTGLARMTVRKALGKG